MTSFFFYGTLCHPPLLRTVLGREVAPHPARLPGHHVRSEARGAFPLLIAGGGGAEGLLVEGLDAGDLARLDFYEDGFGFDTRVMTVETARGPAEARVYVPQAGRWTAGAAWDLSAWAERWGDTVVATAGDVMQLFGQRPAAEVLVRYPMMLVRGASRVRARIGKTGVTALRRQTQPDDIAVDRRHQPYANFFAVEEYDLRFRRFDGSMSPTVNRAAFISGDAAVVLPYDPARDRVMVIEQFRMAPFVRGDRECWSIEAIAGRIDGGEPPEATAYREAVEEAGLTLHRLIPAAHYYPSPSAQGEFLYTYVGIADLPDGVTGIGGVPGEAEDIRSHILPFDRLMELVDSGEVDNAPLILLAYWLDRRRAQLREAATGGG